MFQGRWDILVKILDAGTIPFTTVGRHRRVLLTGLVEYEKNLRAGRKAYLKDQTQQAAQDESYFDAPAGFQDTRSYSETP